MRQKQDGFTLVELAIVLMIIGLLIGGVLRGQEMLANARVDNAIQQVKAYGAAMKTFGDAYGSIPGDMPIASTKLPGCQDGNPNSCVNGNGDAMIGDLGSGAVGQPWISVPADINTENTQFWKHLALAHLITGIDTSAGTPEWGKSHPTAAIGGGFFIHYSSFGGLDGSGTGTGASSSHYLVLRNPINGQWQCGGPTSTGQCVISPKHASQIDRKFDDGIAGTGDVIAISANWQNGCGGQNSGMNGPSGYAETHEDKACDMMFKVN